MASRPPPPSSQSLGGERQPRDQLHSPVSPLLYGTSRFQSTQHFSPDAFDLGHQLVSPIMSRSPSVTSNDRYSVVSGLTSNTYLPSNPQHVNPAPAYVAPLGAAQVVSEHRAGRQRPSSDDDEDALKAKNDVQFADPALALINSFLDQLLFSFLSTARSTSLLALRPAVMEILKARLARDAIASAEEELQELLAGGEEEEEENTKLNSAENNRRWDLELVWKRTRLRVMVYMRLGEMEDEDEERYVKEEELFHGSERRFSQTSGLVSWAAAIFLTGVLEYVAEQTLQVAGQAAYTRARRQSRSARVTSPASFAEEEQEPVVVDDYDVEKVALSSTLGRLWRTWRKSLRSTAAPTSTPSHNFSRLSTENFYSGMSQRRGSVGNGADGSINGDHTTPRMRLDDVPEMQYPEHVLASNIPLPMGDRQRDVDEIEVPGLSRDPDAVEEERRSTTPTARRNSFTAPATYQTTGGLPTPDSSDPAEPVAPRRKPVLTRQRSMSVPTPARTPITAIPAEDLKHTPGAFPEDVVEEAPTEQEVPTEAGAPAEEEHKDEQKANAKEMAPHKRASQDVRGLLDKLADHAPPEETSEQQDKSEHHGLIGGAIAGASLFGAAAAALVYGSKDSKDQASDGGQSAEHDTKTEDLHGLEDGNKDEPEASEPVANGKDVEELDKRKSLLDMKTMIAPSPTGRDRSSDSAQIMTSRKVSVSQPGTPPMMVRTGSDESRKSDESRRSYTLGHKNSQALLQQSPAKRQHMPVNDPNGTQDAKQGGIGVARTSDENVASPVATPTPSADAEEREARGPAKRPSRLILGTDLSSSNQSGSPTIQKTESPKSPREFLESRSLTSKTSRPDFSEKVKQPSPEVEARRVRPLNVPQKRRSIPGLAFTSAASTPVVDKNVHRQSWSAAVQQQREQQDGAARRVSVPAVPTMPGAHKSSASEATIQEHPAVHRMENMQRSATTSDPQIEGDGERALTSASIRGPEDFDSFVQGADTFKYTLTPENVRNGPVQQPQNASPVELSSAPSVSRRSAAVPPIDTSDARTGRSPVSKQATSAIPDGETFEPRDDRRRSISRPPPRNVSAHRRSGLLAREPRVMTESTRDFADFIRSTGPNKDQEVTPVINPANMSTTSLHSLRSAHINGASRSASRASRSSSVVSQDRDRDRDRERDRERTKSLTKSDMISGNIPPVPPVPAKGRGGAMRARTPTGAGSSNSDFIDFIRSGPNEDGQHRISRSVAPFRSTMDSDQLKDMGDRINGDQPLDLSLNTNVGRAPGPSSAKSQASTMKGSSSHRATSANVNTRAGPLLFSNAHSTVHPAHSGQPQRLDMNPVGNSTLSPVEPGATPVRKRHRNKDPYAIDTDDDEDGDLLTALPKNKRPEESLMDFLNNTEPPKDNAPRPIVNGTNSQSRSILNKGRTNSSNSLRSTGAVDPARTKSMQSQAGGPRPGSVRSIQSNSSAPRARPMSQITAGAPPLPKPASRMEARAPGSSAKSSSADNEDPASRLGAFHKTSSTKELADFLKNSGPPDDDKSAPAPIVGRQSKLAPKEAEKARRKAEKDSLKMSKEKGNGEGKKKGGGLFGRFTSRRKTWLDMPK